MRKIIAFFVIAATMLFVLTALAQVNAAAEPSDAIVLKGTIIDNKCATANKDSLAEFVKMHTKACTLMPDCAASGYAIYADGKLMKFDKESSAKVGKFLKEPKSELTVEVKVKKTGEELKLFEIKNQ